MDRVTIIGSGMAGFGAAYRLHSFGRKSVMYEKENYTGGNAASFNNDGFIFDVGPHISFTKNQRMQKRFAANINNKYETLHAKVNNYWKGYWIKHPAQCNLSNLPKDLVVDILSDFIHACKMEHGEINNYEEWLIASYGETFARTFPMEYGLKFHTTEACNMTTNWVGVRLYQPDLKEVLGGALSSDTPDVHYVSNFRYPSEGGFVSYMKPLSDITDLHYGYELIEIDYKHKELKFSNGKSSSYCDIVSSLPLPDLIPMIKDVPQTVMDACRQLACTTCILVNTGLDRADISDAHWTYFYDRNISFTRLSFPHMQSSDNTPHGAGSIQAEIYYSNKYRHQGITIDQCRDYVLSDLKKCGYIRNDDKILFCQAKIIPYANIIFDHKRTAALKIVHEFLDKIDINYCGRYGEWGYLWTDESFISGENAAGKIMDKLRIKKRESIL